MTSRQVKEYLHRQDWFDSFVDNIENECDDRDYVESILNGEKMQYTIAVAFDWAMTPEGSAYWDKVNSKFRDFCDKMFENNCK